MELVENLDKKLGGDCFKLVTRIGSSVQPKTTDKGDSDIKVMPRWDSNFILNEL